MKSGVLLAPIGCYLQVSEQSESERERLVLEVNLFFIYILLILHGMV